MPSSSKTILTVDALTKIFEPRGFFLRSREQESCTAVNNVSFSLKAGEIVGLLGPNGSGKTTIMHLLLGILTPTSGKITYFGKDFATHRSEILQHIGFASAYLKLAPRLTVHENLDILGRLYGLNAQERAHRIEENLKFFELWEMRNKEIATLSAGQATCIMFIKAFLTSPKIVLLDEPTASLDPDTENQLHEFMLAQRQEHNVCMLLATHDMDEASQFCDRVLVLNQGSIIANNTPHALTSQVTRSRVKLTITNDLEKTINYAKNHAIPFTIVDTGIVLEVDENNIAHTLITLAQNGCLFTHVSIEKPTLEDYFLHIAQQSPSSFEGSL